MRDCTWQISGKQRELPRHAGQFSETDVNKTKLYLRSFGYGAVLKPRISRAFQNQAATRRGLACFWEGRFAVPRQGALSPRPFISAAEDSCGNRIRQNPNHYENASPRDHSTSSRDGNLLAETPAQAARQGRDRVVDFCSVYSAFDSAVPLGRSSQLGCSLPAATRPHQHPPELRVIHRHQQLDDRHEPSYPSSLPASIVHQPERFGSGKRPPPLSWTARDPAWLQYNVIENDSTTNLTVTRAADVLVRPEPEQHQRRRNRAGRVGTVA